MKYLGVILDEHLTFDEYITYIITKASKNLGILRRAREFLKMNTKILLYKSLASTASKNRFQGISGGM